MSPKPNSIRVVEAARMANLSIPYIYLRLAAGKIVGHKVDGRWQIDRQAFVKQYGHRLNPQARS